MSWISLVIFVVVTVGLQQVNSLRHCQMRDTSQQCTPGRGYIIYNSGPVWDPTNEEYHGVDEDWNCTACCQFTGKTIPKCDPQKLRHCKMSNTKHECSLVKQNTYNFGDVWDPSQEQGGKDTWVCKPCCEFPGRTIPQCQSGMAPVLRGKRGIEEEEEESKLEGNHCQMMDTVHQCIPGPGKTIYNSGTVWDPSQEEYGGETENWNCTACCRFPGKTIPQCDADMKQVIGEEKEESRQESTELPLTTTLESSEVEGQRRQQYQNIEKSSHCQHRNVTLKCSPGPGRRIYNRCDEWDPACVEDGGEDPYWNCIACCLEKDKSLPACEENMENIN